MFRLRTVTKFFLLLLPSVLEVGWYKTVCHTGTSLDGYKSYRHFRPENYHTSTPQWAEQLIEITFIAKASVISVACMATRAVLAPSERTKICPGPQWGSSRRSPRPTSQLGRGIPPLHTASPWRLDPQTIPALFSFHFEPWLLYVHSRPTC